MNAAASFPIPRPTVEDIVCARKGYRRPTYARETKERAIRLYVEMNKSGREIAKELGLKDHTVKQWIRDAGVFRSMSAAAALSCAKRPRGHRGTKHVWMSPKASEPQIADSSYEVARMKQLDADDSVISWSRCRDRIRYVSADGRSRTYNPDFWVTMRDGTRRVEEIKPARFVGTEDNIAKFCAAKIHYEASGIAFVVLTERDIGWSPNCAPPSKLLPDEMRARRLKLMRAAEKARHARETPAEREARLRRLAEKKRLAIANETPEKRDERLRKLRERGRAIYHNESEEKRRARKERRAAWERAARRKKRDSASEALVGPSVDRALVERHGGSFRDLPPGSFKESGTNVNTIILTMRRAAK